MFELIIIITFELWCVFGFLLLENTGWNFKRFVVRKIKGQLGVPASPSAVPHFAGAHPPRSAAVDAARCSIA